MSIFRCWGDHWDAATGEEMDLNPHIPKPEPPPEPEKEEEKKEEEKKEGEEKKEEKEATTEKEEKKEEEKEKKKVEGEEEKKVAPFMRARQGEDVVIGAVPHPNPLARAREKKKARLLQEASNSSLPPKPIYRAWSVEEK